MRSLLALLIALCATAAQAQCFTLTVSAKRLLDAQLTKAERAAGAREAVRLRCSTEPVPDGTAGALDAGTIRGLVPEIRKHLQAAPKTPRIRAVKAKARPVVRRPVRRAVMPRARPAALAVPPAADVQPLTAPPLPAVMPPPVEPVTELAPELVAQPQPARASCWLAGLRRWLREHW